jgi:orotidine-5'-phosphate decarboxylase
MAVSERSVTVAADVEAQYLSSLARATADIPGISGYKVGLALGLEISLPETVRRIREHSRKEITYDHQKAGNDIPAMARDFARVCRVAGVDRAILFPFSSPVTEEDWIKALQDAGIGVLVGGHMTVPKFLESEGGYIADSAP